MKIFFRLFIFFNLYLTASTFVLAQEEPKQTAEETADSKNSDTEKNAFSIEQIKELNQKAESLIELIKASLDENQKKQVSQFESLIELLNDWLLLKEQLNQQTKNQQITVDIYELDEKLKDGQRKIKFREFIDLKRNAFLLSSEKKDLSQELATLTEDQKIYQEQINQWQKELRKALEAQSGFQFTTKSLSQETIAFYLNKAHVGYYQDLTKLLETKKTFLQKQISQIEKSLSFLEETITTIKTRVEFSEAEKQKYVQKLEKKQEEFKELKKTYSQRINQDIGQARYQTNPIAALYLESLREQVNILNNQITQNKWQIKIWQWLFELFEKEDPPQEIDSWVDQTQNMIAKQNQYNQKLSEEITRTKLKIANFKNSQTNLSSKEKNWIRKIEELIDWRSPFVLENEKHQILFELALDEFTQKQKQISAEIIVSEIWQKVKAVWNYEFVVVDERPVTLGKVLISIILLIFGYFLSRRLSISARKRLYNRFVTDNGARAALQSITFYLLVLLFTIMALHFAGIPLTLFTILGGALAIGVGFGSQNLINNFISGLILLMERPIKAGDMIEVGDTLGVVVKVGARCTHVRTYSNIDILVPNSSFLEKDVVNWTLSDDLYRSELTVGVAYGSPVKKVKELILQAATENERVLKQPNSWVVFEDFGDNTLNFRLFFWVRMSTPMDRRVIASNMRFRIIELFDEHNIVIAFPQRDVHLDTEKPLEIIVKK